MTRKITRQIVPDAEITDNYYAKGLGDPSTPLPLTGAINIKAGEVYSNFTGYNAIVLTKMCGVAINKSVVGLLPERTAIDVSTAGLELVFDRSLIVFTANFS